MSAAKVSHGVTETRREDSASVRTSAVPSLNDELTHKIPRIRFKKWNDGWCKLAFTNIATIRRGLTYSPIDCSSSGIRVLRSSNIDEDMFRLFQDDVFVKSDAVNIPSVKDKDILITAANGSSHLVGKHALVRTDGNGEMVHGGFMLLATSKEAAFLNASMCTPWYREFIESNMMGGNGALGNLPKKAFDELQLIAPVSVAERDYIGTCFETLNVLISVRQSALAKLQALKKSMLLNMFPQGDAKVPKIRFKGFEGEWKEVGYPDIFDHIPSKRYQIQSSEYQECGAFPVLDQGKECVCGYSDNEYRVFRGSAKPVVIFGDHTREVKFADFDFVVGADGTQLLAPKKMDSLFAYYLLSHLTIPNMGYSRHFKFVVDAVFQCPEDILEQRKIAAYFKSLDRLIAARRDEIEQLKHMKAALLNRMFV